MENGNLTPTKQYDLPKSAKIVTPFSRPPLEERLYPGRDKSGVLGVRTIEKPVEIDWNMLDKK
jgi:hypothetical protein